MEIDRFKELVARLEQESAASPGRYRAKVAALTLLGFGILALLLGAVGFGLLALAGIVVVVAFTGGTALLLLAKFGKLLFLLAVPLWYLCKSAVQALFVRLPPPQGREIAPAEAPQLFAALQDMRRRMKGPRFHHVLVVDEVNAAVVQRPAFGLVGWPRNYLLLGLPLLEAMPPEEALAVVAHEYGHLAGSHGHFSAFVYRLRHTWGTIQAYVEHIQGWLGRLVAPLVRWYAPYFNAYTFVLARNDEYLADAASAELVGPANAAHALKRVNLITPRHHRFMQATFERMDHDAAPPPDLMHRWAAAAGEPPAEPDARRWLTDALDRVGNPLDTHPTLRARLVALAGGKAAEGDPPPLRDTSAARAWFGDRLESLRGELESHWAAQVAEPWAAQHAAVQQQRQRLADLRAQAARDADEEIETLRLTMRLEPEVDLRDALAAFNAAHADHALGLFLEGTVRLDKGEREGLALLDRTMALDPEATKLACERAHAFLNEHAETAAAEAYAERWRRRDELETQRAWQLENIDGGDTLEPHGLDAAVVQAIRDRLDAPARAQVARLYLARRVIPADPTVRQFVLGVELTWWGRQRGRQQAVVDRLAAIDWPIALVVLTLEGRYAGLKKRFAGLADAALT
ncbi:MAG: M48 family metallopeptidase [Piscinibacter sp.]|nr:M48 family metallopeptidase [Piscinibacter sp.]